MHDVAWRGMWICVRSKDAQKQLARTSLNRQVTDFNRSLVFVFTNVIQIPVWPKKIKKKLIKMITINDLRLNLDGPVGFLLKFPALFHEHCSDGKKLRFSKQQKSLEKQISLSKCVQSNTGLSKCHFRWTKVFDSYSTVLLLRLALKSWRNICGKQYNLNG